MTSPLNARRAFKTGTGRYITLGGIHTRNPHDGLAEHRHVPRADPRARARQRCTGTCTTTAPRHFRMYQKARPENARWRLSSAARAFYLTAATRAAAARD